MELSEFALKMSSASVSKIFSKKCENKYSSGTFKTPKLEDIETVVFCQNLRDGVVRWDWITVLKACTPQTVR